MGNKAWIVLAITVIAIHYTIFKNQVFVPMYYKLHWFSDIPTHISFISIFASKHSFPWYSLWYFTVYCLAGFSKNSHDLAMAAIAMLAVTIGIKYIITYFILLNDQQQSRLLTALLALGLIFVMPIARIGSRSPGFPWESYGFLRNTIIYLGNIAPNQWHNSTAIFAVPVSLLLFYHGVSKLTSLKTGDYIITGLLMVSSALCKPNFAMCFLPALVSASIFVHYNSNSLKLVCKNLAIIIGFTMLVLALQWYDTFHHNAVTGPGGSTVFAPLRVWRSYSENIPLALLVSLLFPVTVLVFYYKRADKYLYMSWLTFIVGLCFMTFLAEYPSYASANYFWGAIISNYILFVFSVRCLIRQEISYKSFICYSIFGLHLLSGAYLLMMFFSNNHSLLS